MNIKDKLTVSISIIALVMSVTATINSEIKTQYEKKRIIRSQLTDVLSRINKLNMEGAKIFKEVGTTDPEYCQTLSGILNQENGFLLQQAMLLSEQIPGLVSAIDLNTIAFANASFGDTMTAEIYYLKAIDFCKDNYKKSLATKSYAVFLFMQRRYEEGRERFKTAITLLNGNDNVIRHTRGMIYQIWAINESAIGSPPARVDELLKNAEREFSSIDNEIVRLNAIQGLSAAKNRSLKSTSLLPW
jgi:tetratricopeptide (TPR) repeat protein